LDATLDRIEDTSEFHQDTIAHHLDDAAMVLGHQRLQNFRTAAGEAADMPANPADTPCEDGSATWAKPRDASSVYC
jgi:hypothetical protein